MKIGQLTDSEFRNQYPNTAKDNGTAITHYGSATTNYWQQHDDNSWTNVDCKTNYFKNITIYT